MLIAAHDPDRPLHVGTLLGNTPEMLRAMAAAGLGGYVLCGINTTRRGDGLLADVRRADCQFLLTDEEHLPLLEGLDLAGVTVIDVTAPDWAARLAKAGPLTPYREVGAMDTLMMIFTSGTSGDPKAVQVAHLMVLFSGLNLVERFSVTADDVCYIAMPLFHSNAVVAGWAVALGSGAAMVPARFSASRFLADVRHYGATYMNYVGKPLAYILATPEQPDDADNPLRVAFGNEASDRDIEEFARRFDCEVMDGFGSTELAIIITRAPGTPRGSIGQGVGAVAIYDPETRHRVRGRRVRRARARCSTPTRRSASWSTPRAPATSRATTTTSSANEERMRHGMYWSGDLAYRDADGWIYLAGRTADWMRVDGENLAAAPIERIIQRLPAVALVAVYAVPDPNVGDQVMAAIVLQDDATLSPDRADGVPGRPGRPAHRRAGRASSASRPSLPSTATNKVLKRELIAQGADRRRRRAVGARGARDGVRAGLAAAGLGVRLAMVGAVTLELAAAHRLDALRCGTRPTYSSHLASPVAWRRYQRSPRPARSTAALICGPRRRWRRPGRGWPPTRGRPPSPPWWRRSPRARRSPTAIAGTSVVGRPPARTALTQIDHGVGDDDDHQQREDRLQGAVDRGVGDDLSASGPCRSRAPAARPSSMACLVGRPLLEVADLRVVGEHLLVARRHRGDQVPGERRRRAPRPTSPCRA